MVSYEYCKDRVAKEVDLFNMIVSLSIIITVFVNLCTCCAKEWMSNNPGAAAKMFLLLSLVKVLVCFLLLTALIPDCPGECLQYCGGYQPSYAYPFIGIAIGVRWLRNAFHYGTLEAAGGGNTVGAMPVPTTDPSETEMVSTKSNEVV